MSIRINNVKLSIDENIDLLNKKVAKKLKIDNKQIKSVKIIRESLDARKKSDINFKYLVEIEVDNEEKLIKKISDNDVTLVKEKYELNINKGNKKLDSRPVIVGFGPAGIFAGLVLAQKGYRPLIIERGEDVDNRTKSVEKFWKEGKLNLESNVQFGEGGAGSFSDGKLTTRIKDSRCGYVLDELVNSGAPKEIKYEGKPHIGTDILKGVVKNIREKIKSYGGEILFSSKLEYINGSNGKIKSIVVNGNEIQCDALVLSIGHSSRDTYEMLNNIGIFMEQKAFAIGARIEHHQSLINESQYGKFAEHPRLKAAEYRLTYQSKSLNRGVYSFCMCPGGVVVAAASEEERLVSNGMSYHARDLDNANSALVVTVGPEDFQGNSPLAGMEFQRYYESIAYKSVGNYKAPVQLVGDFLENKVTDKIGSVIPSYTAGYEFRNLNQILPDKVVEALKEGIHDFDRKIKGYGAKDAVLTGIETRTSAPVRISRNENLESISMKGLYPAGEGAGFAGGIISAAVDGIKVAEKIIQEYAPIEN